ncbi:MAG: hypothetical protein HKN67_13875, partial [Saprospiraceae bacterium]|nr:hypothetical protein [Saprospiraceae bacterium]
MGKHITYIILLFSWSFSYSQIQTIDSLFSVAQTYNTRDSLDINVLSALQKVFNESKESGTNYRMDEICTALGDFFFNYGLYEDGIEYYAYIFSTNIDTTNKSERLINIYRKIGQSYSFLGQPDSAYTYYSHIFSAFSFPERLDVLRDLVEIYANNNNHRKSLEYNQTIEQLLLANQSPVSELSKVYNNIGYNFHSLKEYENSVDYFEKAIGIHPDLPLEEKAVILGNLAISHYNLGDVNKSIQLLYEASSMIKDDKQRAELNHLIASMHQSNNDYFNALEYYQRAGNYAQKAGQIDLLADIYAGFSTVYNQTHEYDLAFEYFKNYSRLTDSLSFVDQLNQKRILDNQKYIARTEKENRLLKAQQDFQKIKIAQLETEAKNQTLRTEALQNDSIQRVNQLELAIQEKEIAEAKERNNALEITRQKNLVELTNQQLVIARANELNAAIEKEKQQKEFELAQEKIVVQERDAQIKEEKNANEAKAREIEKRKVNQRNTAIIAALLA